MPSFGRTKSFDLDNTSKSNSQIKQKNSARLLPAYDFSLIGELESDHEDIVVLYNQVIKTARNRDKSA